MSEIIGGISEFRQNEEQVKEIAGRIGALIRRAGGYEAFPDNPRVAYQLPASSAMFWLYDFLGKPLGEVDDIAAEIVPEELAQTGGWHSVVFEKELVDTPYGRLPEYVLDSSGHLFYFSTQYFFHPTTGAAFKIQEVIDESSIDDKGRIVASIRLEAVDFSISSKDTRAALIEQKDYQEIDATLSQIERAETITPVVPKPATPQP